MRLLKFLPLLLMVSCIDLITQKTVYNSLYFKGGSWIEMARIDSMKLESNDFTLQFWVSGGEVDINEAPALFSIIDSTDNQKKGQKFSWTFRGPLPYDYDSVLTQPTLTALQDCPENIRDILAKDRCKIAFKFDIGGTMNGPVIGQSGIPVKDKNDIPSRGVTIIDKNGLPTDILW